MARYFPDTMIEMMRYLCISNEEMIEKLGVSRRTFYRYLSCDASPNLSVVIRICNVLNCAPNDLIPEACS